MKRPTKFLIGIGITAMIGTAAAVLVSDKVMKTIKQNKNRHQIKTFVNTKLEGNEKLLEITDELSDDEISAVVGILSKVNDSRGKISVTGKTVHEVTEDVKKHMVNFMEKFM